ncbi:MAG: T9SS type A sorting domain-containing protein [Bacteroidetes bacterium]|nr:T9SS type A sorting domain-containing protein [Bacteroidota bacterium]
MKKISLPLLLLLGIQAEAQLTDTLKVMSYNLLNFPSVDPERIDTLKGILTYAKPDILMVCELTSAVGGDDILFNALNVDGETNYDMAVFSDGPDTDNMVYFNSAKLGLKEQNVITTALRDINEYVLYYKSTDLATTTDTTFFYIYVCHLKASTGFEAERNGEAQLLKAYMAGRANLQNVLIGGDFNFYGSDTEPAWNTILTGSAVTIVDPINSPGHWNSNSSFAAIHTQSTRTASFGGGSTGGMDDRFDFIFMSPDLNSYGNDAKYVTGTYKAFGQDGLHYNAAFIDAPTNTTVPLSVVNNLYHMSDHLPVFMKIAINTVSNSIPEILAGMKIWYSKDSQKIIFTFENPLPQTGSFTIVDLSGKVVKSYAQLDEGNALNVADLDSGMYILQMEQFEYSMKFVKE